MPRRGPLRACGISMIEILGKASTKTKDFNGPIGSMSKRVSILVTTLFPFIFTLQDQWLAILSYADDCILAIESMIETLLPPSTHLFNKIDKLVYVAESLPGKFDDVMNKFPIIIHEFPFLDWALAYVISWLNFLIITLTQWGSSGMKEKEIMVDINCDKPSNQTVPLENPDCSTETTKIPHGENVEIPSTVPIECGDSTKTTKIPHSENVEIPSNVPIECGDSTETTKIPHGENVDIPSNVPIECGGSTETTKIPHGENVEIPSNVPIECGYSTETTKIPHSRNMEIPSNVPDSSQDENKELVLEESSSRKTECKKTENKELVVKESSSKKTECKKTENKELVVKESSSEKAECTKIENTSPPSDSSSEDEGEENEKCSKNVSLFSKLTPQRKRSYEEILESGTEESPVKKENSKPNAIPPEATTSEKKEEKGSKKEKEDEDKSDSKSDLLELFDASWHLSPSRR